MRLSFQTFRRGAFALAIGSALSFGAVSAAASRLPECTDPAADTACARDSACASWCQTNRGLPGSCNERTYCCYCIEF